MHIILTVPLICLLLSGMAAIGRQRSVLGHSLTGSATFHRVTGYLFFVVIFFQMCNGSVRPLETGPRKIAIYVHWITGMILNYGGSKSNTACFVKISFLVILYLQCYIFNVEVWMCILTYLIPASPTSRVVHTNKSEFSPIYNHSAPILLIVWIVLDVAFHVFMTVSF